MSVCRALIFSPTSATETTAKTLDATIGFLALYEDIQEELHKEIMSVTAADEKIVRVCPYSYAVAEGK
jgi:major membrane immunogen (membrane-anchored lipoprotein)